MISIHQLLRKFYLALFNPDPIAVLIKHGLVVGRNFHVQEDVVIDSSHCWHITIGDDVTLAPRVHILAHDASTKMHLGYTRIGKVKIGNRVFIGASSTILPGVTIGNNVVIGAGSVVSRDVPDGVVAVGNPAKVVGSLDDFLARRKAEMTAVPLFDESYQLRHQPSADMKAAMNEKLGGGAGYII